MINIELNEPKACAVSIDKIIGYRAFVTTSGRNNYCVVVLDVKLKESTFVDTSKTYLRSIYIYENGHLIKQRLITMKYLDLFVGIREKGAIRTSVVQHILPDKELGRCMLFALPEFRRNIYEDFGLTLKELSSKEDSMFPILLFFNVKFNIRELDLRWLYAKSRGGSQFWN